MHMFKEILMDNKPRCTIKKKLMKETQSLQWE